jgi:ribosome-binding protein aMBF1 (putative translation factor)
MATCKGCGEEADELVSVRVAGKTKKVCADCAERAAEEEAVGQESEAAVQRMMVFKGRR